MDQRTLKTYKPIEMLKPYPLDTRSYFSSYSDALEFANSSTVAYEGEIISIKMENGQIAVYSLKTNEYDIGGNFILTPVGDHVSFKNVDELPIKDIEDIIYILSTDNIGYIYTTEWVPLIYPKIDTINELDPSTKTLASEKAIVDFVNQKISDAGEGNDSRYITNINYNKDTGDVEIVKPKSSSSFNLEGLLHNPSYNPDTRTFTFPVFGQETPLTVTLGKDIFIDPTKENKYNLETGNIELHLNDGSIISIPARELVDIYTSSSTDSVITEISSDNIIKSNVRISSNPHNALQIIPMGNDESGLFVENKDYQPNIDEALTVAKKYTDTVKASTDQYIQELSINLRDGDISTLESAKKYSDTLIRNFTSISQNSLYISFISTNNQSEFVLENGTYNAISDIVELYINGLKQPSDVIIKSSDNTINLTCPLPEGYKVDFKITKLDMSSNTASTS